MSKPPGEEQRHPSAAEQFGKMLKFVHQRCADANAEALEQVAKVEGIELPRPITTLTWEMETPPQPMKLLGEGTADSVAPQALFANDPDSGVEAGGLIKLFKQNEPFVKHEDRGLLPNFAQLQPDNLYYFAAFSERPPVIVNSLIKTAAQMIMMGVVKADLDGERIPWPNTAETIQWMEGNFYPTYRLVDEDCLALAALFELQKHEMSIESTVTLYATISDLRSR